MMRRKYRLYVLQQILFVVVICALFNFAFYVYDVMYIGTSRGEDLLNAAIAIIGIMSGIGLSFTIKAYLAMDRIGRTTLPESIISNHGSNIGTVVFALRDELFEHWAIFDPDNNIKITEQTLYSNRRVTLNRNLCPDIPPHHTSVHCHPSIEEVSFSSMDFYTSAEMRTRVDIVVTLHHIYVMKYGNNWINPREIMAFANKIESNKVLRLFGAFPAIWRLISIYNSYRVAKKFGLKFSHYRL